MDIRVLSNTKIYEMYNAQKKADFTRNTRAEEKRDMVAMSSKAKDFQSIKNAIIEASDVRSEKVNHVKEQIDNDMYTITSKEVANKMINKMLF